MKEKEGNFSVGIIILVVLFSFALSGLSCMKDKQFREVKNRYEDGQEREVWVYQKYRKTKVKEVGYFESGKIRWEREIKNGVGNGMARTYYESGKLENEVTLKNDRVHGVKKNWHENGQLYCRAFHDEGEVIYRDNWDEEGNPIEVDMERN